MMTAQWFDEAVHPAVHIFGVIQIPAFVIPLTLAFVFLSTHDLRGRLLRLGRQLSARATEASAELSSTQDLDQIAAEAISIYHLLVSLFALYARNISCQAINDIQGLCLSEIAALALGGVYFEQASMVPCSLAALGWTLLLARDYLGTGGTTYACLLVAMAFPCAWQLDGNTKRGPWASATLLMVISCDCLVPRDTWWRGHTVSTRVEDWRVALCIASAGSADYMRQSRAQEDPEPRTAPAPQQDTLLTLPGARSGGLLPAIARLVLTLVSFALSICIAAFGLSCLNWRSLLIGLHSEPPGLNTLSLSAGTWVVIFASVFDEDRQIRSRRTDHRSAILSNVSLCVEALGWTIISYVTIWGFFLATMPVRTTAV